MADGDTLIAITSQEEKELQRVYTLLSDYQLKVKLLDEIREIEANAYMQKLTSKGALADTRVTHDESALQDSQNEALRKIKAINERINELDSRPDSHPDKKISVGDVTTMLKTKLKVTTLGKKEVEDMVWEVDDDLDGFINWGEFRLMYTRNNVDRTGLEPSKLFNLAQFLIYDKNFNARVSVDETMNMLYARYGRVRMETKLKEMFGDDMHEEGRQGGEISYEQFIRSVERIQMQTFWNTTKGEIAASKKKKKKIFKSSVATDASFFNETSSP